MATKVTASKIGRFDRRFVLALLVGGAMVAALWWFPVRSQTAAHNEYKAERDLLEQRVDQVRVDIAAVESGTGADVENLWQVAGVADAMFPSRVTDSELITFLPDEISAAGLTYDNLGSIQDGDTGHSTMMYRYVDLTLRGDLDRILAFIEDLQAMSGTKFITVHDPSVTGIGEADVTVKMQVRFWYSTLVPVTSTSDDTADDGSGGIGDDATTPAGPTSPDDGTGVEGDNDEAPVDGEPVGGTDSTVDDLDGGPVGDVVGAATDAVDAASTAD